MNIFHLRYSATPSQSACDAWNKTHQNSGREKVISSRSGKELPTIGDKIKAIRNSLEENQTQFGNRLGVDQSLISLWENNRNIPPLRHVEQLANLAGETRSVFLFGEEARVVIPEVPVVGTIGAGQEIYPIDDYALGDGMEMVDAPFIDRGPLVAVRVIGNSMYPIREKWLLFYSRDQQGVPDHCINQLCAIKVADGRMLVKEIRRGRTMGRFDLNSWNAAPIDDVEVEWASEILDIRPHH